MTIDIVGRRMLVVLEVPFEGLRGMLLGFVNDSSILDGEMTRAE